jgi:hypothetical protein
MDTGGNKRYEADIVLGKIKELMSNISDTIRVVIKKR